MSKNRLALIILIFIAIILAADFMPKLDMLKTKLISYIGMIWWPVMLGLLIGGAIDHYIPKEYISNYLATPRKRTILLSVLLGFLASTCSHGILAISMELNKKGASNASVISFLLASPWASMPVTFLILRLFALKGFLIIISAIIIAIFTGFIFLLLDKKGLIEKNINTVQGSRFKVEGFASHLAPRTSHKIISDIKGILRGAVSLADMVLFWVFLGILFAGLVSYIPLVLVKNYLGPNALGLFATLLLAAIIEVCSEGSSPLAAELYQKTHAFGNSFAFLMGGVVTDFTEIGLIWANLGKKTATWFLLVTIPQVILFGWLFNRIFLLYAL